MERSIPLLPLGSNGDLGRIDFPNPLTLDFSLIANQLVFYNF